MRTFARVLAMAALGCATASPLFAESDSAGAGCTVGGNIVVSARTPEVDLFDAPSGTAPVSTLAKADFPSCLPILEQSPSRMLKVEVNGKLYWVQPHTVVFNSTADKAVVCRKLAVSGDEAKTGSTRGLGEGC